MLLNLGCKGVIQNPKSLIWLGPILLLTCIIFFGFSPHVWMTIRNTQRYGSTRLTTVQENRLQSQMNSKSLFDATSEGAPEIIQISMRFGDHYDSFYERAFRSHIEHGKKWGYPTHILRQDIIGKGPNEGDDGAYNKLLYMQYIMIQEMIKPFGARSEWLVWFDADTVLTNSEVPWTTFLPPSNSVFNEINMLVTADKNGFNAGVFLLRVCEWSLDLLSDTIALPRLHQTEVDFFFKEQAALRDRFDTPERIKHRLYVPQHWFNPYDLFYQGKGDQVMNGTMNIHFPGIGHEMRAESMGLWLDKLERDPDRLRIPLAETSYLAETEAYWNCTRDALNKLQQMSDFKKRVREMHEYQASTVFDGLDEAEMELSYAVWYAAFDESKVRMSVQKVIEKITETIHVTQREIEGRETV